MAAPAPAALPTWSDARPGDAREAADSSALSMLRWSPNVPAMAISSSCSASSPCIRQEGIDARADCPLGKLQGADFRLGDRQVDAESRALRGGQDAPMVPVRVRVARAGHPLRRRPVPADLAQAAQAAQRVDDARAADAGGGRSPPWSPGSPPPVSIHMRSMAPGSATDPNLSAAPSSAGPLAVEQQDSSPSTESSSLGVRADVQRQADPAACGPCGCSGATARRSDPTNPPTRGGMYTYAPRADRNAQLPRLDRHGRPRTAGTKGARVSCPPAGRGRDGACRCCPRPPSPRCPRSCRRAPAPRAPARRFTALTSTRCSFSRSRGISPRRQDD